MLGTVAMVLATPELEIGRKEGECIINYILTANLVKLFEALIKM